MKTRFAPSPTGFLHVGGARTALFNYLYARNQGGSFLLRIEDTDIERSTEESTQAILEGMKWLGLEWDEGPFYQSQRTERYRAVCNALLNAGLAYHCYCSKEELENMRNEQMAKGLKPRYDGRFRDFTGKPPKGVKPAIRFKNPTAGEVVVYDKVKGRVVFRNDELDDLIIWRSDVDAPTYNFCVVVDDFDMGITDVIRGDDHLNNTPRQINMYEALGAEPPSFAHVPMILGDDGQRLSKRHGAVSVLAYRDEGYTPEALLNYLVRLGWSHGDQEIFSMDEMVGLFDVADVNRAASVFNTDKLNWLNQHYLRHADPDEVAKNLKIQLDKRKVKLKNGPALSSIVRVMSDRVKTLSEMADRSLYFFEDLKGYDPKAAEKHLTKRGADALEASARALAEVTEWEVENIHGALEATALDMGVGMANIAQPLRVAITGTSASPSIEHTLALTGRDRTLKRIDAALDFIETQQAALDK
jgi:glutamyl-tRNA synthetase